MSWEDVFWHLINFLLPALIVSLGVTTWGRYQYRLQTQISWLWRWVMNVMSGVAVLVAGVLITGLDGKMYTYGAMVLVCATVEWALQLRLKRRD